MTDTTRDPTPARRLSDTTPVVSVISPTFNESANVGPLIDALGVALADIPYEIVIVDDDSPDRTWEVVASIGERDQRVRVIRRIGESGLSSAVLTGLASARGSVLAVIDADLQHDEAALPAMIDKIRNDEADVVVGTRASEGGSYGDWGPGRRFVSWVATMIAKIFLRVPATDPMSGFFAISRTSFDELAPTINPQGFKILLEFIGRRSQQLRVAEVGYTFRNRLHGETKLSPSVIRSYLLAVVELRLGRQVSGRFFLYALVGLSGFVVNLVTFSIADEFISTTIHLGFSRPVRLSLLIGIQASIIWNFLLNNYFTFWERRFHRNQLVIGLLGFQIVSLLGVFIHVAVFQFLESNRWGFGVLGSELGRLLHDAVGFTVALVSNYFLNVNYTWRGRSTE